MRRDLQHECNIIKGNDICKGLATRAKGHGKKCSGLVTRLRRVNIVGDPDIK